MLSAAVAVLAIAMASGTAAQSTTAQSAAPQAPGGLEPVDSAEATALVQRLGAATFAEREAAASEIFAVGAQLLGELKTAAAHDPDPEIRLRAQLLYQQIASTDFEARAAAFIADGTAGHTFAGWSYTAQQIGNNQAVRRLFVAISRNYPEFVAALDGTPRQRAEQVQPLVESIQRKVTQVPETDNHDTMALLLLAADPNVPLTSGLEATLLTMLYKGSAGRVRQDAQLADPFNRLLGRWVRRARLDRREDILAQAMQLDIDDGLTLALRTLVETNDPAALQLALQAIARFGGPQHAPQVQPLLDDSRLADDEGSVDAAAGQLPVQIGDVAMATIAVLHRVSLDSIGFAAPAPHSKHAFVVGSLGFPVSDPTARAKARAAVEALLDRAAP